jgi:adenylate cyclase
MMRCSLVSSSKRISSAAPSGLFILSCGAFACWAIFLGEGTRRLAAIMFTDMVGYTALGQRDESLSLAVVEAQQKLLRPVLARHGGREVKTMGDAFLVEFTNALEAARCAYDVQRSVREFNLALPAEGRIHLRVGIHLGDLMENQGDIFGDAVNVASKIELLAEDGGVCLTQQVYDHVHNKFDVRLVSKGKMSLKNVSEPLEVYRMVMPWDEEEKVTPPPAQLDKRRIAVLPFANMSPDPNDSYFADGMTEELISTTSTIPGLTLIARTSVMGYKGTTKRIEEIARELSVGTVLEGSVRKAGNRLRISVQLIDVQTQGHLWTQSYDRDFDDVFAVQGDIAKRVAEALKVRMLPDEVKVLEKKPTENAEAYAFYVRAMQVSHGWTERSLREALDLFNRAVSEDPTFARAYAGLSQAWWHLAVGYEDFTVANRNAEVAAAKALELDPGSAEAHASMSLVQSSLDRFDRSIAEAERAIEINPSLADAHHCLGLDYAARGTLDQALAAYRRAFELDPLSVIEGFEVFEVSEAAGKKREGVAVLERMNELHPNTPIIYAGLAWHHMWERDYVRAREMLDKGLAINPREILLQIYQGVFYAITGRRKEAQESLQEIRRDTIEANRLWGEVFIQAALGNLDEAFKALWRQAETHSWYYLIKYTPLFKELRKDPRFLEFCTKVGIPPPSADLGSYRVQK